MKVSLTLLQRLLIAACSCLVFAADTHGQPSDGCSNLAVNIFSTSQSLTMGYVNCTKGSQLGTYPNGNISPNSPVTVVFTQGVIAADGGPNCQFNIMQGQTVYASLIVQQDYCWAQGGDITYSVASGPATFTGASVGSYGDGRPGMIWVIIN